MQKINRTVLSSEVPTFQKFSTGGWVRSSTDLFLDDESNLFKFIGTIPSKIPSGTVPDTDNWLQITNRPEVKPVDYTDIVLFTDIGGRPEAGYDNAEAFETLVWLSQRGKCIRIPSGTYETSRGLKFTKPSQILCDPLVRIKLTAEWDSVIEYEYRDSDLLWHEYRPSFGGGRTIIDGNGFANYGITLRGVINGTFNQIQCTNVKIAGIREAWTQLCTYIDYICSGVVEPFSTTPSFGILIDYDKDAKRGSSANTYINPTVEHVVWHGICGYSVMNCVFLNGTSEHNGGAGIWFGNPDDPLQYAMCNTVLGMDLEVNTATDIYVSKESYANDFIGLKSGFRSPAVQCAGYKNTFIGGSVSDFDFYDSSHDNHAQDVVIFNPTPNLVDKGTNNTYTRLFEAATGTRGVSTNPEGYQVHEMGSTNGAIVFDPSRYGSFRFMYSETPLNIQLSPNTGKVHGGTFNALLCNSKGDGTVVNWSKDFRLPEGWTPPKGGRCRGMQFMFDKALGKWYLLSETQDMLIY